MIIEELQWQNMKYICDDDIQPHEKRKYVKMVAYTSIAGFLLSIPQIYSSIFLQSQISSTFFYALLICSAVGIITSVIAFFWANRQLITFKVSQSNQIAMQYPENEIDLVASLTYVLSATQILLNIALVLYCLLEQGKSLDYSRVTLHENKSPPQKINSSLQKQ